jgi:hypothetical protein
MATAGKSTPWPAIPWRIDNRDAVRHNEHQRVRIAADEKKQIRPQHLYFDWGNCARTDTTGPINSKNSDTPIART